MARQGNRQLEGSVHPICRHRRDAGTDPFDTLSPPERFTVELLIDPSAPQAQDDVYRMLDADGEVLQTRTARDDAVENDDRLTLVFTGLVKGSRYTLTVDQGDEGAYEVFENVLLDDLMGAAQKPEEDQGEPEEESEPESGLPEDESDSPEPWPGEEGGKPIGEDYLAEDYAAGD